jgi:hypothetical protein
MRQPAYHPDDPNGSKRIEFRVSSGLINGCPVCRKTANTSRCGGCRVVSYCGPEHHAQDWPAHKPFCSKIKKARLRLEAQDIALRAHPGDEDTPPSAFEDGGEGMGKFWGFKGTQPYMQARRELVDALLKIHTKDAVDAALAHCADMMRLNTFDNQGMGNLVPALFLRLGRDINCYNTLRWTHVGRNTNTDAMEPVADFLRPHVPLAHLVANALVKVRLLVDMRRMLSRRGPHVFTTDIMTEHHNMFEDGRLRPSAAAQLLKGQVMGVYVGVCFANKHFWPALLNPGDDLTTRPNGYAKGSKQEMQIALQQSYDAWVETPGSFEVIREIMDDPDVKREMAKPEPSGEVIEQWAQDLIKNPKPV